MPDPTYETGVIHGRFQVLHNDHVRYLLAGKALCRHLVVGITNPDPLLTAEDTSDPDRSSSLSNPLTYWERFLLVNAALEENGFSRQQFSVVPLPINHPWAYQYYVPLKAVFFLSMYDDWTRKKLELFKSLNLKIHILRDVPPEEKGLSATEIRQRIVTGQTWKHMVPAGVYGLLEKWNISDRLKKIYQEE